VCLYFQCLKFGVQTTSSCFSSSLLFVVLLFVIRLVKAAPAGPGKNVHGVEDLSDYYDMAYSDELKRALDDLEFEIKDGAAAHGVDVPEERTKSD
jgi:hypothetical protein